MFSKSENTLSDVYVCIKLSTSNSDLSDYQAEEYKQLVAKDLSTGVEKYVYKEIEDAEAKLLTQGTNWSVCHVRLSSKHLKSDRNNPHCYQFSLLKPDTLNESNIEEVILHPLLRKSARLDM